MIPILILAWFIFASLMTQGIMDEGLPDPSWRMLASIFCWAVTALLTAADIINTTLQKRGPR